MIHYTITIFLSAFLLFQVQPLIGKYILPWFGGTPAVWTTCMLFFQALLVVGYAYAHTIAQWMRPRTQVLCHITLLALSAALLPITPSSSWKPTEADNPTAQIFLLLLLSVGGPYVLLASTAPLLQSWFARAHSDRSPYWLYALSNAGSLLGLFTYPFVVEHTMTSRTQTFVWSTVYGFFVVMCGVCAIDMWWRGSPTVASSDKSTDEDVSLQTAAAAPPRLGTIALWLALSACGSVMLLATTNRMCQDVASVPFLWVLPLGLYLLSFILVFGNEKLYRRQCFAVGMMLAVMALVVLTLQSLTLNLIVQIVIYACILVVACFVCHGELVHLKPAPRYLTQFYVVIAVGGALGGVLVTLVAPLVFVGYFEFNAGLIACMALLLLLYRRDRWQGLEPDARRKQLWITASVAIFVGTLTLALMWTLSIATTRPGEVYLAGGRNFYGALRVMRRSENNSAYRRVVMSHGSTIHGVQFDQPGRRETPTMYYNRESGAGLAIENHPRYVQATRPLRLGLVGLGAGTLCCYARAGDVVRCYEIDPQVVELSRKHFTFQSDARRRGATVEVFLGDARIVMERQLAQGRPQRFDVLAIDAFSSDAIPLHLLTRECFQVYAEHLHPKGILAVHVSNRHLDLRPAVKSMAEHYGYRAMLVERPPDHELLQRGMEFASGSVWGLLTRNDQFACNPVIQQASRPWPGDMQAVVLTDESSSLFQLLRW